MITVEKHLAIMDNGFTTNTYIVTDEETGEVAVVDPSFPEEKLLKKLNGKNVKYVLLTHGHFDHICGAKMVKENTGAKVVIHKEDDEMLHDISKNEFEANCEGCVFPEVDADIHTEDGTELMLGNTKITVMHTPGHSKGGVCYLFKEDRIMFSGDTLFRLCAGRADLYGGSGREELRSLAKIGELEGDYKVYPGHEGDTTLDYERENNRYMRTRFRRK
jgi:glyoxylase-like metal-dependent hydrolase (beta-lactamase superfamily II)